MFLLWRVCHWKGTLNVKVNEVKVRHGEKISQELISELVDAKVHPLESQWFYFLKNVIHES